MFAGFLAYYTDGSENEHNLRIVTILSLFYVKSLAHNCVLPRIDRNPSTAFCGERLAN